MADCMLYYMYRDNNNNNNNNNINNNNTMMHILYVRISMQWWTFCMCIYLCDDAHFVWPRVRSFLRVFTLVLATPPRGIRPNHTLLPIVRRFWIFLLFKKMQKLKIKIYAKSVKPPPLWVSEEETYRAVWSVDKNAAKHKLLSFLALSWHFDDDSWENERTQSMRRQRKRKRKILPAVYLEEEWVSRTMGSGQLWGPIVRQQTVKQNTYKQMYSKIYIVFQEVEHANTSIYATHRIRKTDKHNL